MKRDLLAYVAAGAAILTALAALLNAAQGRPVWALVMVVCTISNTLIAKSWWNR